MKKQRADNRPKDNFLQKNCCCLPGMSEDFLISSFSGNFFRTKKSRTQRRVRCTPSCLRGEKNNLTTKLTKNAKKNRNRNLKRFFDGIDRIKDRIIHVHISDCNGKTHSDQPPGQGVIDFKPYLQKLKDIGYDGAVSVELEYAPEGTNVADWIKEAYESTNSMMQEIGIRG